MKSARVSIGAVLVLGLAVVSTPTAATAKSITVKPGESIQAAVDAAAPGDTIKVMPGDYTETHPGTAAVRITKPLKLIAKSKPTDEGSHPAGRRADGTASSSSPQTRVIRTSTASRSRASPSRVSRTTASGCAT